MAAMFITFTSAYWFGKLALGYWHKLYQIKNMAPGFIFQPCTVIWFTVINFWLLFWTFIIVTKGFSVVYIIFERYLLFIHGKWKIRMKYLVLKIMCWILLNMEFWKPVWGVKVTKLFPFLQENVALRGHWLVLNKKEKHCNKNATKHCSRMHILPHCGKNTHF